MVADDGYEPDMVLAIARGGLLIGGALGYALSVKNVYTMNVEFYTGVDERLEVPRILPPAPDFVDLHDARILIADDVADTGHTLRSVQQFCEGKVAEVRTAVLYEKSHSVVQCDYVWKRTDLWINFPWSDKEPGRQAGVGRQGRLSAILRSLVAGGATSASESAIADRRVEALAQGVGRDDAEQAAVAPHRDDRAQRVELGQHRGQVVVGVGLGQPAERRHQRRQHHPRPLLGGHRPQLVLEHEAVELAVVAAHGDGAGTAEARALPDHRVGVHVGARLGDAEPRQLADVDAVEPLADVGVGDLGLGVDGDEHAR